ncbi:MAG: hypothetical protein VR69_01325 [Peptococcaceae bacterium BRH_c4b]|nr:MAG: hypothetical protein VR69_01325 [Peptococcaceae bacterium BRH_c4b]
MPYVHCTVNSCSYWQNGNLCNADNIVIQNDQEGGFPPNAQLSNLKATPAGNMDDTCCQTFKNARNK